MAKHSLKVKIAAAGVAALAVIGGGTAYSYWSSGGSGTGSATADGTVTVTLTGDAVSGLAPDTEKAIEGTVTVTGAPRAEIGAVTPSIKTGAGGTTFNTGCSVNDYSFTAGTALGVVDSGTADQDFGKIKMLDREQNQDGCKGQVLVLQFSAS